MPRNPNGTYAVKLPRPKTEAQLSAIGRKGAAASVRAAWLNGDDRPPPTLYEVQWLLRPDPWPEGPFRT